ncbi:helix-turn-helix transcriptional regulator [Leisingera caerulea]|uniref:Helix-turn-helix domain-containing protein n=1 Tax=Leisingera caerulea TaxID=506591 RepID=A0A9Q9HL98_LEICA|nr:helix-turn-helix domain-containing protein [Leisingera caerulea]UWQ54994.1 helix-turn-helix domain-containing protein [Leisingera caerulea]
MYLSDKQLAERFNVSRQTIWRWARTETFPPTYRFSAGCVRWRTADIESWERGREIFGGIEI